MCKSKAEGGEVLNVLQRKEEGNQSGSGGPGEGSWDSNKELGYREAPRRTTHHTVKI